MWWGILFGIVKSARMGKATMAVIVGAAIMAAVGFYTLWVKRGEAAKWEVRVERAVADCRIAVSDARDEYKTQVSERESDAQRLIDAIYEDVKP